MSGLDGLIGREGAPAGCKVISDGISVHWWRIPTKPGDPCLCGETTAATEHEDTTCWDESGPCGAWCFEPKGHDGPHRCCDDHEW